MKLAEIIKKFPAKPGVYLFKSPKGEVLYVGKAKSLRSRVASYFRTTPSPLAGEGRGEGKIKFLIRRASDIEFIVTDSEKEAFLLENTLIKKHNPRYNIQLKDDKTYVSIRVGTTHPFAGVSLTRRVLKDGAAYFGPFTSSTAARETVEQVIRSFKLRTCSDREFANRVRPCLEFDIGRCSAPCVEKISEGNYREFVKEAIMFLKGARKELVQKLKGKMKEASMAARYEEAARLRDAVAMIEETLERQKVVVHGGKDTDVVGLAHGGGRIAICVLMVRGGVLMDRRMHAVQGVEESDGAVLESFLIGHYAGGDDIPANIVVSHGIEGKAALEAILAERRRGPVRISVPKRGAAEQMAQLAVKNAGETLKARSAEKKDIEDVLGEIRRKLRLTRLPETIECLDISNLMGREAYGSLVVFRRGEPDKARYRLYSIRTLETPDDYGMMREVLLRRFKAPRPDPDLLLIDGGKGQLGVATKVLDELGLHDLPVAAIAKTPDAPVDRIFLPGRKNPVTFKRGAPAIFMLMRIRDEAHRFGLAAHRRKRIKSMSS